jgi:hypothetical protein
MGSRFIRVNDMSCVRVNVSGLGVAFFCPGGEYMEGVVRSFRGRAWGIHEILDSLIKNMQRLSLVSHVSFVWCLFGVSVRWFEGLGHT